MGTITVNVELTDDQLDEAGYHVKDDCSHENCHDDDGGDCNHDDCPSSEVAYQLERHTTDAHHAANALHDWHETTHGYTIWSGCRQEPCNVIKPDFRKRS